MIGINGTEYVYVPNGSYLESFNPVVNPDISFSPIPGVGYNGVSAVPLGPNGARVQIPTPDSVNSCAANQNTGVVVCTSNHNDIYLINAYTNTLTATLHSSGDPNYPFFSSGGACVTCGVVMNAANNTAIIGVSVNPSTAPGQSGYQILNLVSNQMSPVFYVSGNHVAEAWAVDTDHNLLLSAVENIGVNQQDWYGVGGNGPWSLTQPAQFELFDLNKSGPPQYDFSQAASLLEPNSELDATAQDATGVTVATEEFTGNVLLSDLSQKKLTSGAPGSWNAPSRLQNLPEFGPSNLEDENWVPTGPSTHVFYSGQTGVSVATGTHYGFMEDEFGGGAIAAFTLPAKSKANTAPSVLDYVIASLPNDPFAKAPWENPFDPHGLAAAYANIGTGNAYGVVVNTTFMQTAYQSFASPSGSSSMPYSRTTIAVVSLPGLMAAPRVSSCTQYSVPVASIVESGNTVTVTTSIPHGFLAGQTVTIGDTYGPIVDPSGSFGYSGNFTIASVPDAATTGVTFTYSDPVGNLQPAISGQGLFFGGNATYNACVSDPAGHFVDPSYDLVKNGVVRYFPVH
jgi:hypothetical protein